MIPLLIIFGSLYFLQMLIVFVALTGKMFRTKKYFFYCCLPFAAPGTFVAKTVWKHVKELK